MNAVAVDSKSLIAARGNGDRERALPAPLEHAKPMCSSEAGVIYQAVVYGGSGYAEGNLGILRSLARHRIPVQLLPTGPSNDRRGLLSGELRAMLELMQHQQFNPNRSVHFQSAPAADFDTQSRARWRVAHTFFETDSLPDGWVERLETMDEIWVRSSFNRDTFASAGVNEHKLRILPEGVDTTQYRPGVEPLSIPHRRRFNFLSVFDWDQRKGYDVLLRAYLSEFKADDDVALILKIYAINHPFADPETRLVHFIERELKLRLESTAPVILLNGFIPSALMPHLYATASAFVLPSRGEGWGRPYLEALACQCPVIATRWGGQLDFLHEGNSFLLDVEGIVPVLNPNLEVFAGHRWAEPSVDHRRRAARGRAEAVERWDWQVVGELWAREFRRLLNS